MLMKKVDAQAIELDTKLRKRIEFFLRLPFEFGVASSLPIPSDRPGPCHSPIPLPPPHRASGCELSVHVSYQGLLVEWLW